MLADSTGKARHTVLDHLLNFAKHRRLPGRSKVHLGDMQRIHKRSDFSNYFSFESFIFIDGDLCKLNHSYTAIKGSIVHIG